MSLWNRWTDLWTRLGVVSRQDKLQGFYNELMRQYSEEHRHYHAFSHIQHCLTEVDEARDQQLLDTEGMDKVELALWYHDAVYFPRRNDNEEESALELKNHLEQLDAFTPSFVQFLQDLIMATKHMNASSAIMEHPHAQLVSDIDLAILGQPSEVYDHYEANIRREYEWVPIETYRQKRAEVLQSFLNKSKIYLTSYFNSKYDERARINLRQAIDKLEAAS
eukprot:gb/GECG01006454.1/.p1 GENE.gb/GECG01006454.1/~~gb/GECG01006454.1/.p1  ORF type:complete len:221 (+),score=37.10 gb/GECG01006454.1/:1-663(+)